MFSVEVCDAYEESHTRESICPGFFKTGLWCDQTKRTVPGQLSFAPFVHPILDFLDLPSVKCLVESYGTYQRSLSNGVDFAEGTVGLEASRGLHVTRNACLEELDETQRKKCT